MSPDNLEARVTKLESQVHQLTDRVRGSEQDAAAARVLAGAADRDVTEFRDELRDFRRATTANLSAVREDLIDLRGYVDTRFSQIDERFNQVDARFNQVDNGFIGIRGRLDAAAAGQQQIVELLERLIADQD